MAISGWVSQLPAGAEGAPYRFTSYLYIIEERYPPYPCAEGWCGGSVHFITPVLMPVSVSGVSGIIYYTYTVLATPYFYFEPAFQGERAVAGRTHIIIAITYMCA
eukprot:scaffold14004_cov111-Isochrysis_galbana.AAC.2